MKTLARTPRATPRAQLSDVGRALAEGGFVRHIWSTGVRTLVWANGSEWPIDGRTYRALIRNPRLRKTETGSSDAGNLVMEWRA